MIPVGTFHIAESPLFNKWFAPSIRRGAFFCKVMLLHGVIKNRHGGEPCPNGHFCCIIRVIDLSGGYRDGGARTPVVALWFTVGDDPAFLGADHRRHVDGSWGLQGESRALAFDALCAELCRLSC